MSAITKECRPKLARKAKLKWDRHANTHMLLYPERGLVLNETATAIVKLCDGERTVAQIASELAEDNESARSRIEGDVVLFLESLLERALLTIG
jgi:pyrroloquinoline quinone biosynthesis protein D